MRQTLVHHLMDVMGPLSRCLNLQWGFSISAPQTRGLDRSVPSIAERLATTPGLDPLDTSSNITPNWRQPKASPDTAPRPLGEGQNRPD